MPTKKHIRPGEKVPLKLTSTERKLILEGIHCVDQEYEQIVRDTPSGEPVLMSLDALDDFGGYVAAEANHCDDKKKQKKLDAIFQKIQDLLDKYSDAELSDVGPAKPRQSKQSKAATGNPFQFKITLLGAKPPIWRRIQVEDCTLDKLHEHIQTAMGWTNSISINSRSAASGTAIPSCWTTGLRISGVSIQRRRCSVMSFPRAASDSRSSTSTTSVTDGNTRSCSRAVHPRRRAGNTPSAWKANVPVRPKTSAAFGATRTFSRPSPIPSMRNTTVFWSGAAVRFPPTSSM